MEATIDSGGRLLLPKALRELLGITPGSTVDISLSGLDWHQKQWLRKRLLALEEEGQVLATEEARVGCFHIFVYPTYGQQPEEKPAQP